MSTYMAKPGELKADWHVIDATDQVLGRLDAKVSIPQSTRRTARASSKVAPRAKTDSCLASSKVLRQAM